MPVRKDLANNENISFLVLSGGNSDRLIIPRRVRVDTQSTEIVKPSQVEIP